jgi:hypothetical protein
MTIAEILTILNLALKVSLVIFMVGNLFDMGLRLKLQEALAGLRDPRFVVQACCGVSSCCRLWPVSSRRSFRWRPRMPWA